MSHNMMFTPNTINPYAHNIEDFPVTIGANPYPVIVVLWKDSALMRGWVDQDVARKHTAALCVTTGVLVKRDATALVLASSLSVIDGNDEPDYAGLTSIPIECVVEYGVVGKIETKKDFDPKS